jgi:hypothetical protein
MQQFYKKHRIEITPWLDLDHWVVNIFIFYQEETTAMLVTFALDERFATGDLAIKAGLAAAREWIDRQTPELG